MRIWVIVETIRGIPRVHAVADSAAALAEFNEVVDKLGYKKVSTALHQYHAYDPADKDGHAITIDFVDVDDGATQAQKLNVALGRLAPKGTWLCEVFEKIWFAKTVEEAVAVATAAAVVIEKPGADLWIGDRKPPCPKAKSKKRR
jgi:hypothetical protein